MVDHLVCWSCGADLAGEPMPLSRRAECRQCRAELHVCRLCCYYDPRVAEACREERAEFVKTKDRSNFCDYFSPRPEAYQPRDIAPQRAAEQALAAMFGGAASDPQVLDTEPDADAVARRELDALFGNASDPD